MYENLHASGLGAFSTSNAYFSSVPCGYYDAETMSFADGAEGDCFQTNSQPVRAARRF